MNLLIACAKVKNQQPGKLPAKERYASRIFRICLEIAAKQNLTPIILSAKYGFIAPEQKIGYYDNRLSQVYFGDFPPGDGWFVGGQMYFGMAPANYTSLLPYHLNTGEIYAGLQKQLVNFQPSDQLSMRGRAEQILQAKRNFVRAERLLVQEFGKWQTKTIKQVLNHLQRSSVP